MKPINNNYSRTLKLSNTENGRFIINSSMGDSTAYLVSPISNNNANCRYLSIGTKNYGTIGNTTDTYYKSVFYVGNYITSVSRTSYGITDNLINGNVTRLSYGDIGLINWYNYQNNEMEELFIGGTSYYYYSGVYIDYYGLLNQYYDIEDTSVVFDYVDKSYYNDMLYFSTATNVYYSYYDNYSNTNFERTRTLNYVTPYNLVPINCWYPVRLGIGNGIYFDTYYCYLDYMQVEMNTSEITYYLAQFNTNLTLYDYHFYDVYSLCRDNYQSLIRDKAYDIGYDSGYDDGYDYGMSDSGFSVLDVANTFLDTEILPGFKLSYVVYLAIGLLVLPLIFRLIFH